MDPWGTFLIIVSKSLLVKNLELQMAPGNPVAGKWPPRLLISGFIPTARIFLRNYFRLNPGLDHFEAIFVINLIDYSWGGQPPFPSWHRISEDLGIPVERVVGTLDSLKEKGYLEFVPIQNTGGQAYSLKGLFRELELLMDRGEAWVGRKSPRQFGSSDPTSG